MKEVLESYSLSELKKIISNTNIKGYSRLKKPELVKLMMRPEHKDSFKDLKPKEARTGIADEKDMKKRMALVREFKKKAKRPREVFELKEAQKKIEEQMKKKEEKKKEKKEKKVKESGSKKKLKNKN